MYSILFFSIMIVENHNLRLMMLIEVHYNFEQNGKLDEL